MKYPNRRGLVRAGLLMALSATAVFAQPAQPTIRSVIFYKVKADRVADFLAAETALADAMKKGGSTRSFTLWVSLTGEREYAIVQYHQKWAELEQGPEPQMKDMAGQVAAIFARIFNCTESSRRVHYSLDADLSLPIEGDPPPMARVLRTWVRPEHIEAYRSLMKSNILPAAKKSGSKLHSVARVRFGGSAYEFSSITGLKGWADLDAPAPLVTAMGGQEAYDKFLAKLRPLLARSEYEMYRYIKSGSYIAPMK